MDRRTAIKHLSAAPLVAAGLAACRSATAGDAKPAPLRLATFQADITPSLGSPLCGGLVMSAQAVDDRLDARGVVLVGDDKPIVLCALDWVQINNGAYDAWCEALAAAAGTDASRVAVQCVHPHNTPWVDVEAEKTIQAVDDRLEMVDVRSAQTAKERTAAALKQSLGELQPVTHLGIGQGEVKQVASNRRILGHDGKVIKRMSKCTDEALRSAPEGQIDPQLKTVSFWNGDAAIAALHYYATHPMSYYGDGRVTTDFCGLARNKRQQEQPGVFQVYFTGCAGDIAAGKYNDGSPEMRPILRDRVHAGMVAAWKDTKRSAIGGLDWTVTEIKFPPRAEEIFSREYNRRQLSDNSVDGKMRIKAAIVLSWLDRLDKPVEMSCLRIGGTSIVHLPGEPFIDFQFFAQSLRPKDFVCVAGYGDGGMGYIPLHDSYGQGGYEPTWSFVAPQSEQLLRDKLRKLLV